MDPRRIGDGNGDGVKTQVTVKGGQGLLPKQVNLHVQI